MTAKTKKPSASAVDIRFSKLHPDAQVPQYQTAGAACFDLHAIVDKPVIEERVAVGVTKTFGTGLAFEVPHGHVMLIFSRSGHGFTYDTRLANCVGVIDSDYRGEVKVKLTRDLGAGSALHVKTGDRIAQALVVPMPQVTFTEAVQLSETERGTAGFGSTGNGGKAGDAA